MRAWRIGILPGTFALCFLITSNSMAAETNVWLPIGSSTETSGLPPKEYLKDGEILGGKSLIGKLLFNSPSVLGEKAVRIGLSCNSCHPNGHVNTSFYISGLSSDPGTIDLSNRFWRKGTEDGKFNPIAIPSLRNVLNTAPYGTVLSLPDLPAFTRHVISDEFGGPPRSKDEMEALIGYMNLLEKETGSNMSRQVQTIPIGRLLDLLVEPVKAENREMFDFRSSLIKEELGRHLTSTNEKKVKMLALRLNQIERDLVTASQKAKAAFDTLIKEAALY